MLAERAPSVGDTVTVTVVRIDRQRERVALSLKSLEIHHERRR
ncbi:S1 RNA-binding domain-containing protein [Actinospica robiniae]